MLVENKLSNKDFESQMISDPGPQVSKIATGSNKKQTKHGRVNETITNLMKISIEINIEQIGSAAIQPETKITR